MSKKLPEMLKNCQKFTKTYKKQRSSSPSSHPVKTIFEKQNQSIRFEYCVMRIAKTNLKKQTQFQMERRFQTHVLKRLPRPCGPRNDIDNSVPTRLRVLVAH